jgi:hypothetical protein
MIFYGLYLEGVSSIMIDKSREKYKQYVNKRGGIFTPARRNRLLKYSPGRNGHPSTERTDYQFRYKLREFVKQALIDFEMFLELADRKDVLMVFSKEALEPVIDALLKRPEREYNNLIKKQQQNEIRKLHRMKGTEPNYPYDDFTGVRCSEPDRERAEIASMFIQKGFNYLTMKRRHDHFSERTILELEDAIMTLKTLVNDFKVNGDVE